MRQLCCLFIRAPEVRVQAAECVELFTLPDILPLAGRSQGSLGLPTPASVITFIFILLQVLFHYQTQGAHIRTGRYSIPKL